MTIREDDSLGRLIKSRQEQYKNKKPLDSPTSALPSTYAAKTRAQMGMNDKASAPAAMNPRVSPTRTIMANDKNNMDDLVNRKRINNKQNYGFGSKRIKVYALNKLKEKIQKPVIDPKLKAGAQAKLRSKYGKA